MGTTPGQPWLTNPAAAAPSKAQQIEDTALELAAVAGQLIPGPYGAVINEGVQLEPEIHHLISALIHLFHKQKVAATAAAAVRA